MSETRPQRIQRKPKGWRMPPGGIYVGRPTIWGNPFQPSCKMTPGYRQRLVDLYRAALTGGSDVGHRCNLEAWFRDRGWLGPIDASSPAMYLAGHDLACWCPLDQPCHADVLLELANADASLNCDTKDDA